jgi:hypothetical protein
VSAEGLANVRALQAAAVGRKDFELAQQYEWLLRVATPRESPWATAEVAPRTLEEQAAFFFENGFVVVEDVLQVKLIHRFGPYFGSTLTISDRDSQSHCWVNLKIMGQPCEF